MMEAVLWQKTENKLHILNIFTTTCNYFFFACSYSHASACCKHPLILETIDFMTRLCPIECQGEAGAYCILRVLPS